ncbi:unnamed protein product [Choristocarpus tenellus]
MQYVNATNLPWVLACMEQVVKREVEYALTFASIAPSNESPWNYIRGFFRAGKTYADFPEVKEGVLKIKMTVGGQESSHLHNLLAEINEHEGTEESLNEAINILQRLRNELDSVRAQYWEGRLRRTTQRLSEVVNGQA